MSTSAVPAAAVSSASTVATDPVPNLLVPQHSNHSVDSDSNEDGEDGVFLGVGLPDHFFDNQEVQQGVSGH